MHRALPLRLAAVLSLAVLTACATETDETAVPADTTAAMAEPADTAAPAGDRLIDPETATREQLLGVPNINEQVADAIIAGRPYSDMLAVDRLLASHLSEEQRREAYRSMFKPMDVNNASREEILLIPDVDPRMPHEFDEYRPYTDMEQFRREIGKYVSAEEVARYEKYVEIRR